LSVTGIKLKRSPLHEIHLKYGGKMIDFGGWELPVQYSGIIEEHRAVRKNAGLFDVSHMGEISVEGDQALDLLQELVTNDVSRLEVNQVQYTPMCNDCGGILDDLVIYRRGEKQFLLVVNAANTERDFNRVLEVGSRYPGARVANISDQVALLALQGPQAQDILQELTDTDLNTIKYFWSQQQVAIAGRKAILVSRTGYTGEDGFEIYCSPEEAPYLWEALMERGKSRGLVPAGLGARDTLRFEVCLPLYGNELTENTTPLEAGLTRFVKLYKPFFHGKEALVRAKKEGLKKKLVGLEMVSRGIARSGYRVLKDDQVVGEITSGSYAPTLDKNLALGYVQPHLSEVDTELLVEARGRFIEARVVSIPFYKREV